MGEATYRKKPVEIAAMLWSGGAESATPIINWILDNGHTARYHEARGPYVDSIVILTLEGDMIARPGDYIIRGVQGEFYPCKPDIFEATYEKV